MTAVKVNTDLEVCLSDGTSAKIIHKDRKNTKFPIIALVGPNEILCEYSLLGESIISSKYPSLMNRVIYDGLKAGMKYNNAGMEPLDWDRKLPLLLRDGRTVTLFSPSWTVLGTESDIVLYHPIKQKVKLELSAEEANTLYSILRRVGGDPVNSPRKHAESIYSALWKNKGSLVFSNFSSYGSINFFNKD